MYSKCFGKCWLSYLLGNPCGLCWRALVCCFHKLDDLKARRATFKYCNLWSAFSSWFFPILHMRKPGLRETDLPKITPCHHLSVYPVLLHPRAVPLLCHTRPWPSHGGRGIVECPMSCLCYLISCVTLDTPSPLWPHFCVERRVGNRSVFVKL